MAIIPQGDRLSEAEATAGIRALLRDRGSREASYRQIWVYLGSYIEFTKADREWSGTRGEPKWHTVVRNIAAHADQPGNAVYEGILLRRERRFGGGFMLTQKGLEDER